MRIAVALLALAGFLGVGLGPAVAPAAAATLTGAPAGTPLLVVVKTKPPSGYRLDADQVLAIASRSKVVIDELRRHRHLLPYEYTRGPGTWQVSWFTPRPDQKEMIQVYVDDLTGQVTQAWTGYQVAWTMARGYVGAFGRVVTKLYVWLPLCAAFLLPFVPWRRRPTLWHLDLLVLLSFSVSLAFFNHADLGMSVPLVYVPLLYLFVRLLLLALGRGRPREPLRLAVPVTWLALGLVFLIGFRIALDVTDSNVIDVGFAGVIGANKILHGEQLYGHFPATNPDGDTYGPINYDAYIPFNVVFGWSGYWDSLPAAHAAAICFDLLTMFGLFLLGRLVRGPTLGIVLAYLWAAFPFTLYVLCCNSNDALVSLLVVVALLLIRWAPARGVAAAFAGLTKFAPLALGPLLLRGVDPPPTRRQVAKYIGWYALAFAAAMAPVVLTGDLGPFWRDTIVYQADRPAPFSIWGLWGGTLGQTVNRLAIPQHLEQGATIAIAIAAMFVPRRRGMVEVAAVGAVILIALQLGLTYWFYLYIAWFFPLVIIALAAAHPPEPGVDAAAPPRRHRYLRTTAVVPARVCDPTG